MAKPNSTREVLEGSGLASALGWTLVISSWEDGNKKIKSSRYTATLNTETKVSLLLLWLLSDYLCMTEKLGVILGSEISGLVKGQWEKLPRNLRN